MQSLGVALGSRVLAAQLLRKLDQRFLVLAGERLRNDAQNEDAGELQTFGGVHRHQLHGVLRLAGNVLRSQRRHRIVIRAVLRQGALGFLEERDVLQKFAQRSVAGDLLRLAAPVGGEFLKALQRKGVAELERSCA